MTQNTNHTREQNELIAEFCTTYGLDPGQITFYDGDARPSFDREATAILIHRLTNAVGVEDDLVPSVMNDSIQVKYRVTFDDGSFAGSTGTANLNEKLNGEPMSPEQIKSLATSRASRSALTNKGIDLVKLHYSVRSGKVAEFVGAAPPKGQYERLLAEAHCLGREVGLIMELAYDLYPGEEPVKRLNKDGWKKLLGIRYGVENSNRLNVDQLSDFVAFLKALRPESKQAA